MKFILALFLVLISVNAWAIPDQLSPVEYTTSGGDTVTIKTTPGTLYGVVNMNFFGVSTGRKIQLIDATGVIRLTLVAGASAGKQTINLPIGAYFNSKITLKDLGQAPDSGTVTTDIQFF